MTEIGRGGRGRCRSLYGSPAAVGFTLTVATIWLIPFLEGALGWGWAFAFLAPGPALGVWAMLRLRSLPEASGIAGGRG